MLYLYISCNYTYIGDYMAARYKQIALTAATKDNLDKCRSYRRETYDDIISRLCDTSLSTIDAHQPSDLESSDLPSSPDPLKS